MKLKGVDLVPQPAVHVRHGLDGLQDQISQLTGLSCEGDAGKTKQADKDACDINKIMARYQKTGVLPDLIKKDPMYGDFSDVGTFQEALEKVQLAELQFAALDAHIRKRFENDPAKFLEFATDSKNSAELIKLGLATRNESAEASTPSQPANAAGAAAGAQVQEGQGQS